jgi:hypothetical protein
VITNADPTRCTAQSIGFRAGCRCQRDTAH